MKKLLLIITILFTATAAQAKVKQFTFVEMHQALSTEKKKRVFLSERAWLNLKQRTEILPYIERSMTHSFYVQDLRGLIIQIEKLNENQLQRIPSQPYSRARPARMNLIFNNHFLK